MKPPPVILVGAGPGDPNLITVAGLKAIQRADVIIHDRLIPLTLLDEAPNAERIDAGKRAGDARLSQDQINALLIKHARQGQRVVRLKGGDPFVFGRGGEEATALTEAGLEYEIIPGVSSATAAAALTGIPVTDRRAASAFTVVTGHEALAAEGAPAVDWNALAQTGGTLVILMGWRNLPRIVEQLIAGGLNPNTPAAAVERASTPQQRSLTATLADLPQTVTADNLRPPLTVIIGSVVNLAQPPLNQTPLPPTPQGSLPQRRQGMSEGMIPSPPAPRGEMSRSDRGGSAPPTPRPLQDLRILITRPQSQSTEFATLLRQQGAEPILLPTIELVDTDPALIRWAVRALAADRFDDLILTSVNGVERLWSAVQQAGLDTRAFAGIRISAIGPATARTLERHGLAADLVPQTYTSAALLDALIQDDLSGRRILLARAAQGSKLLSDGIREHGAMLDDIPLYDTRTAQPNQAALDALAGVVDVVTLTSPSTARGLRELARLDSVHRAIDGALVVCIGPVTAAAARELGWSVSLTAQTHTIAGLVESLSSSSAGELARAQVGDVPKPGSLSPRSAGELAPAKAGDVTK